MSGLTPNRLLQAALFVVAVVGLAVLSPVGAAMVSPALALVSVLWLGWFTGERSIAWVRRVARRRHGRRLAAVFAAPRTPARRSSAGISLAFALAMRPPPHRASSL